MGRRIMPVRMVTLWAVLAIGVGACSQVDTTPPAPKPQPVSVTADDEGWTTTGTEGLRAGWISFTLKTKEGEAEHGLQLIRLKDGAALDDVLKEEDPERFLEMAEPIGGFVGVTGAEIHTFTIRLEAGPYAMVDFGETDEGPNFLRGMTVSFEVAPGDGIAGVRPSSDGDIVMREFVIDLPEDFTGRGTYLVRNVGGLIHELNIGRFPAGIDVLEEIRRHAETGRGRGTEVPGLAMIAPGREAYLELNLSPGFYAFACLFSEGPEGPHVLKGMYAPITVG